MGKTKPQYINELSVLYETYKGQEVADAVGVSVRQIQNYLKEDDPPTPSTETIANIREAYAKHINGEAILRRNREDFKDKYILSLEDQIKTLKSQVSLLTGEMRHIVLTNQAILQTNQDLMIEMIAKQRREKYEDVAFEVGKAVFVNYERAKQMDILPDVGR